MEETALPLPVRPCTDLGNAERLARRHGADLRYCHPWGKWLIWDGRRWRIDDSGEVQRRAALTMRAILEEARYAESKEARERLARWALSSEAAAKIEAAVKLCRSIPGIPVSPADLDGDPWLLNVSNGVLDLRTGELRRHRREDMITKIAPVHFDSAATCPRWLALLDRSMAQRADLVTFLQRSIGYALTGSVGEQVLLFFHGGGANGKSTILETLLGILGNYAIQAAADLLIERPGESHPTEQADLAGRRLVVCQEAGKGRHCDEALVKRLTGGDTIKARRMREDFWEFFPTHKLFVSANHRPSVRGCDEAIWRRLRLVPFEVAIPAAERDRDLLVKLRAEWPGILAWAVQGCLAWQREGLNAPKEVRAATAAYRREQDHLAGFLRDRCVLDPDARVTRKALREAYEEWCRDNGEAAVSPRALAEMLREHGVKDGKVRHPNTRLPVDGWSGVRPKTEDDQRKDGGQ